MTYVRCSFGTQWIIDQLPLEKSRGCMTIWLAAFTEYFHQPYSMDLSKNKCFLVTHLRESWYGIISRWEKKPSIFYLSIFSLPACGKNVRPQFQICSEIWLFILEIPISVKWKVHPKWSIFFLKLARILIQKNGKNQFQWARLVGKWVSCYWRRH